MLEFLAVAVFVPVAIVFTLAMITAIPIAVPVVVTVVIATAPMGMTVAVAAAAIVPAIVIVFVALTVVLVVGIVVIPPTVVAFVLFVPLFVVIVSRIQQCSANQYSGGGFCVGMGLPRADQRHQKRGKDQSQIESAVGFFGIAQYIRHSVILQLQPEDRALHLNST